MFDISQQIENIVKTKNIKSLFNLLLLSIKGRQVITSLLEDFLVISSIELTEEIPTAAIRYSEKKYSLYLNPKFLTEYVKTSNCLLFVILHELYHKIYGDFFLKFYDKYRYINKHFINIICDLKINTDLYKTIFDGSPLPILERLYWNKEGNIIQKLFCPPEVYLKELPEVIPKLQNLSSTESGNISVKEKLVDNLLYRYPPNLAKNGLIRKLVFETYKYLWFTNTEQTSLDEIFNLLYRLLQLLEPNFLKVINTIPTIGSGCEHSENPSCKNCGHRDKQCPYRPIPFPEELAERFKRATKPGYNDILSRKKLEKIKEKKSVKFYNAVLAALTTDFSTQRLKEQFFPEYGFIPEFTRKEVLLLSSGFVPVVYQTLLPRKELDEMKVHLYIDVSGSTQSYHKIYYGFVLALKDIIGMPVYAFSNKVVEITLEELKNGIVVTTGGTDIDCVITHAARMNFHRILLLTDGQVEVSDANVKLAKAKPIKIYTVFTIPFPYFNSVPHSKLFEVGLLSPQDRNRTWWVIGEYLNV